MVALQSFDIILGDFSNIYTMSGIQKQIFEYIKPYSCLHKANGLLCLHYQKLFIRLQTKVDWTVVFSQLKHASSLTLCI